VTLPDRVQLAGLIAELRSILDDLEEGIVDRSRPDGRRWSVTAYQLIALARAKKPDGFPPPSSGEGGGSTGGSHGGGPVPMLVMANLNDADRKAAEDLVLNVQIMASYGRHAVKVIDKATPENQRPDRPMLDCCRICSRPGKPEPIYRSERCQWCYRFWLEWKVDVPPSILKLRREGRAIYDRDIRDAVDGLAG
jgi:hypothetical protein